MMISVCLATHNHVCPEKSEAFDVFLERKIHENVIDQELSMFICIRDGMLYQCLCSLYALLCAVLMHVRVKGQDISVFDCEHETVAVFLSIHRL